MRQKPIIPERYVIYLCWSILLTGIALRIVVFIQNRSLFIDEANLSLNYATKGFGDLWGQLDNRQFAPPLFSIIEKVNTLLFGINEYALRLFPLISGIALLWAFYMLLKKYIPMASIWCIWFPLSLLAFSPYFVRYATEVKQYSTDALVTVVLLLTVDRLPAQSFNFTTAVFWAIAGSIVIWLSMPVVFVLAGVWAYYAYAGWRQSRKVELWLSLPLACWLLSFTLYFFSVLKSGAATENLREHHTMFFFPLIPTAVEEWNLAGQIMLSFFRSCIGKTTLAIGWGILSSLTGIIYWYKKDRAMLCLLLVPIVACLFASSMQYYSLMPRLTLFFLPVLIMLIGQGSAFLWGKANLHVRTLLLAGLIVIVADWQVLPHFYQPYQLEEIKPVMAFVKDNNQTNDQVYVNHHAVPAFLFYSKYHNDKMDYELPGAIMGKWDRLSREVPNREGRLWLIFSHTPSEEVKADLATIAEHVVIRDKFVVTGASAYLVQWIKE